MLLLIFIDQMTIAIMGYMAYKALVIKTHLDLFEMKREKIQRLKSSRFKEASEANITT